MENSTKDTPIITVIVDIVDKYRGMLREFAERRRKVAVCGIIPRYDDGPAMFRKVSVINRQVDALTIYSQEGMHYFYLWHHFYLDRTLYACDGLHLNCMRKARLGRVIRECLADILCPLKIGKGSTADEDINRVASEDVIANVIDNNHIAPETEERPSIDRQEETGESPSVPVTNEQETQEEDFQ